MVHLVPLEAHALTHTMLFPGPRLCFPVFLHCTEFRLHLGNSYSFFQAQLKWCSWEPPQGEAAFSLGCLPQSWVPILLEGSPVAELQETCGADRGDSLWIQTYLGSDAGFPTCQLVTLGLIIGIRPLVSGLVAGHPASLTCVCVCWGLGFC